jgi:hypothetical protein
MPLPGGDLFRAAIPSVTKARVSFRAVGSSGANPREIRPLCKSSVTEGDGWQAARGAGSSSALNASPIKSTRAEGLTPLES